MMVLVEMMNHRRLVKLNQYMLMQNMYINIKNIGNINGIKNIGNINGIKNIGNTDTKVDIVKYEDTVTQEYTDTIQT